MINSTSSQVPQNPMIDNRLNAQGDYGRGIDTLFKVMAVALAVFAVITAISAFLLAGPVIGGVVTFVLIGLPLILILQTCCERSPNPRASVSIPWHQRAFRWAPTHVPVGGGHIGVVDGRLRGTPGRGGHVGVGDGHLRGTVRRGGHIGVGDGHLRGTVRRGGHVGVGDGHLRGTVRRGGHVGVGDGHLR